MDIFLIDTKKKEKHEIFQKTFSGICFLVSFLIYCPYLLFIISISKYKTLKARLSDTCNIIQVITYCIFVWTDKKTLMGRTLFSFFSSIVRWKQSKTLLYQMRIHKKKIFSGENKEVWKNVQKKLTFLGEMNNLEKLTLKINEIKFFKKLVKLRQACLVFLDHCGSTQNWNF